MSTSVSIIIAPCFVFLSRALEGFSLAKIKCELVSAVDCPKDKSGVLHHLPPCLIASGGQLKLI